MDRLLAELRREFHVLQQTIAIGDLNLRFYRVADPEALLTDEVLLKTHAELEWQPYWAQSWLAAEGVARELATRPLAGRQVLDLGCGLGLAGTVAAACGAEVVLADYAPPAVRFAELNSWPFRDRVQVLRLDWRRDRLDRHFDLIVGSDILYDRDDLPYLDAFWRQHLKPQGSVLLADPDRPLTADLLAWIKSRGWLWRQTQRVTPLSARPVRLVELHSSRG